MKKLLLLCALVCASQLYGMEKELEPIKFGEEWKTLPDEIRLLILTSGDNLDAAIKNVIKASEINKQFNTRLKDIKKFTALVHMLADTFNTTTLDVAIRFGKLPMALEYRRLNVPFMGSIRTGNTEAVKRLIKENADVNCTEKSSINGEIYTPLRSAGIHLEIVMLLLANGADPNYVLHGRKAIDYITSHMIWLDSLVKEFPRNKSSYVFKNKIKEGEQIKELLENAMKK